MAAQTLPNTKNDLIVSLVQRELIEASKLAPYLTDYSSFAAKGVKSVQVPRLSGFTVANRAFGAAGVEQTLTDAVDTINIDQNSYIQWGEDHADIIQSSIEFRMEAAKRAGSAHGDNFDTLIFAGLNSAASLNVNGGAPADITKDNILAMREYLLGNDGKLEDFALFVAPDQERVMLDIAEFIRADHYGSSNIPGGRIGQVYGVPVVVSNRVGAQQAYMFEKAGYGYAIQRSAAMAEEDNLDYGTQGKKVVMDMLWGHGGLQLNEKGASPTQSALVAKLAN